MSSPDVLDMFYNHIYHQNVFRSDFGKTKILDFLKFFTCGFWVKNLKKPRKTAINREKPWKPVL